MNPALLYLLVANSVNILADTLFVPIYALFIALIGGGPELAGILFGIKFASEAFFVLIVQRLRDKSNLDRVMFQASLVIRVLSWLFLAFNQNIPALVAVQILLGLAGAVGSPAFNSLVSENLDSKRHIHEWGLWDFMGNAAVAFAAVLSGYIMVTFGFTHLFVVIAILEGLALVVYYFTKNAETIT